MNRYIATLMVSLSVTTFAAFAAQDIRAITEDGRKVLLSPDGSWRIDTSLPTAPPALDAGSPYQPSVKKFSVRFNPSEWSLMAKRDDESVTKRVFQHKTLPIYGMVISDEIPTTNDALKNVVISNAKSAGSSMTVLLDETQEISGKSVGLIRFAASSKGYEFVFSTAYYGDGDGNIQVACYTVQPLFFKYQGECQKFLSGLTIK